MTAELEIDEVLRRLGSVAPPVGMERRVRQRLHAQQSPRVFPGRVWVWAAFALVAGIAIAAILLTPAMRTLRLHSHSSDQRGGMAAPRVAAPVVPGGFGAASAVHVPAGPVAVPPTPVNQGRGRSRSAPLPQNSVPPVSSQHAGDSSPQ